MEEAAESLGGLTRIKRVSTAEWPRFAKWSTVNRIELGKLGARRYNKMVADFCAMDGLFVGLLMRFHGKALHFLYSHLQRFCLVCATTLSMSSGLASRAYSVSPFTGVYASGFTLC